MLSLKLPTISQKNTLITHPPKTTTTKTNHASSFSSSHYHYSRFQSHLFSSQPMIITKHGSIASVPSIPNAELEDEVEEEQMPEELREEMMPKHVAVIMDGNRRWAKMRGLPSSEGHVACVQSLKRVVKLCLTWRIKVLTVFMFSTENWRRSKEEVEFIFSLLERVAHSEIEGIMREGIKLSMIGDSSKLPRTLQRMITTFEESTKDNSRFQLIVAINYGGKYDILQACKSVVKKVQDNLIHLEDINERIIEKELETKCTEFPCPDLMIRTSGELRISNFLLWQLAYTELYFTPQFWPDFGKDEFLEALRSFQQRQRRFGGRH
ncbi:dehydrodolichyl diphosphate synthase 2-like [Vicia villosa]|uniref:dehydrodolichyl diphosphate synthase 2-like n=1 Tax=Vicia villosa TaxID=3911 RepID=UPI00273BA4F3|nr:dehydrodolichyl diphosphate synthase 2-like [Vicia villosa]